MNSVGQQQHVGLKTSNVGNIGQQYQPPIPASAPAAAVAAAPNQPFVHQISQQQSMHALSLPPSSPYTYTASNSAGVHSAALQYNSQRQASQNTAQANQPVNNASISNAVNNLAQNTAHLLSQTNPGLIGLGSIGPNIPANTGANAATTAAAASTTASTAPSASSNASSSVNAQPNSISNLNNLLLVQQLLNTSLPQLQNAANANPMALTSTSSSGKYPSLLLDSFFNQFLWVLLANDKTIRYKATFFIN